MGIQNFIQSLNIIKSTAPKIIMLGSGLETSTRSFVYKILNNNTIFSTVGIFPGKFEGIGSGFNMKMSSGLKFDLMTLYSNIYKIRNTNKEMITENKLLVKTSNEEDVYELHRSVKSLCSSIDAVIFAVDCLQLEFVEWDQLLLKTLMKELKVSKRPLLVLNLHSEEVNYVPCINIVDALQLHSLDNPWEAHSCAVDNLSGFEKAFTWLIQSTEKH